MVYNIVRCQSEFQKVDEALAEEEKLDKAILSEIERIRELKSEEVALSALERKISEMLNEASEFGEKVKGVEKEIQINDENAKLLSDLRLGFQSSVQKNCSKFYLSYIFIFRSGPYLKCQIRSLLRFEDMNLLHCLSPEQPRYTPAAGIEATKLCCGCVVHLAGM